ncbi:G-protein coupled receptor 54-like [Antedon mediterranea]|uniref:G-protein coupled receptor 54-like n=1 Tax=Antedon mediterranea TaxID=105859 RepID=UPI003AF476F7
MRTATNYFLANLAMTDIALLLTCALPTTFMYRGWAVGPVVCRIVNYMMLVSVQATCLTLAIMSIDRYRLVVLAIRSRNTRSKSMVVTTAIVTWIVSFTTHIPTIVYMTYEDGVCLTAYPSELSKKVYIAFTSCTTYFLPLASIFVCYLKILIQVWRKTSRGTESAQAHRRYVRRRRRVTRMVFTIVILFAVCWAPCQASFLIDTFHPPFYNHISTIEEYKRKNIFRLFTQCLAYTNSAMNPIVYGFAVKCFRKYLMKMFFAKVPKKSSCVTTTMQVRNGVSTKYSRYSSEDML